MAVLHVLSKDGPIPASSFAEGVESQQAIRRALLKAVREIDPNVYIPDNWERNTSEFEWVGIESCTSTPSVKGTPFTVPSLGCPPLGSVLDDDNSQSPRSVSGSISPRVRFNVVVASGTNLSNIDPNPNLYPISLSRLNTTSIRNFDIPTTTLTQLSSGIESRDPLLRKASARGIRKFSNLSNHRDSLTNEKSFKAVGCNMSRLELWFGRMRFFSTSNPYPNSNTNLNPNSNSNSNSNSNPNMSREDRTARAEEREMMKKQANSNRERAR
jgi:hypothetical protein